MGPTLGAGQDCQARIIVAMRPFTKTIQHKSCGERNLFIARIGIWN
jgi:hypothetical protein